MSETETLERLMFTTMRHGMMEFHIAVRGKLGAIDFHFWVTKPGEESLSDPQTRPFSSLGVEFHRRVNESALANRPTCFLLKGEPCQHDGTSLWASEFVMPAFLSGGSELVWSILEGRYADLQ